jgi:hypothetical protein
LRAGSSTWLGGALIGAAVLTSVLGAAAGFSQDVCSKMVADRVEGWIRASGGEAMLTNRHLNAALGDAIAEIISGEPAVQLATAPA